MADVLALGVHVGTARKRLEPHWYAGLIAVCGTSHRGTT